MALTSDNEIEQTRHVVVTMRIPNGADAPLVADAAHRIERANAVRSVTIEEVRDLEPRLSATIVSLGIRVQVCIGTSNTELNEQLSDVPGLESIE
jgi:hypothetical protein